MSFRPKNQAPKGYVPGLGRGAAGFTTRSDIGPAATGPVPDVSGGSRAAEARRAVNAANNNFGQAPKGYVAGAGRGAGAVAGSGGGTDDGPTGGGYDPFEGYQHPPTTAPSPYDQDDEQADQIYAEVEERMRARRKKRKAADEQQPEDGLTETQTLKSQFRELKEKLADVTDAQWANIPDVGDFSLKHKQKRREDTFTPLSDSLLESRVQANHDTTAGNKATAATAVAADGFTSVANMSGLAQARGTVLGMSLDRMSASASGQSVVDPQGYLTSLSSTKISSNAEVGDINKARLLLKSVRDTNPKHGPGWIASARVEEAAGKILQARKLIQEGCETCPSNEDVWLEAARLHPPNVAKSILATAVRRIPTSTKIFLRAADLETNDASKKAVLRKALEANPTSVKLWKAAIELEDADDARILLSVAVEKIPDSVEMWLALARLESYENARRVLNQARKALPGDRAIWIAAAKLEESQHHVDIVDKIIDKAVKSLQKHDAVVTRSQWLEEAEHAEHAQAPLTCAALVRYTLGIGVDLEDRLRTWADDAKDALSRGSVCTARAIIAHALASFPTKRNLWMQAVDMERKHGSPETLDEVLAEASKRLPKVELFWLFRAKERWSAGEIEKAREILTEAFAENPNSEAVWLAASKLEWETGEIERARLLLQRARERAPSGRVFMKSALLEREEGLFTDALALIDEGIKVYPDIAKLYMMGGQICSDDLEKNKDSLDKARQYYQKGLQDSPSTAVIWILASRLEERAHTFDSQKAAGAGTTKARSLLELARLKNQKNPELWLEAIRMERRAGNEGLANTLMARALQECPASGLLLAENIRTAPRVERKSRSADAIKRCPEDPHVISAVASLFASDRKNDKARKWFNKAVSLDPDLGDTWARYYAFELKYGNAAQQADVKARCVKVDPKHGEIWTGVMKDMKNRRKTIAEGIELVAEEIQQSDTHF
jgi:pre-mRNA-processing factor 6